MLSPELGVPGIIGLSPELGRTVCRDLL